MDGARPVLTLRLADTTTAIQLWSGEFPLGPDGLPDLREDALGGVSIMLGLQLVRTEALRSGRPAALEASELLERARATLRWSGGRTEGLMEAWRLLEECVRRDESLPLAWALLAVTYLHEVRFSADRAPSLQRADDAIRRALAMRLSPRDPQMTAWHMYAGMAHLHLGHHAAAVEWLTRGVEAGPESAFGRLFLAGALGASGRIAEGQAQLGRFQQLQPGYSLGSFRAAEPSDAPAFQQQRQRLYDGLRRVGMRE